MNILACLGRYMKPIKVAISQRIIPHYRVSVFCELARREHIDFTVYYGSCFRSGTEVNASAISGFIHKRLFTIKIPNKIGGTYKLLVVHPSLLFRLIKGKYDVVVVEPTTNFLNDISVVLYCGLFRKKFIWYEAGGVPSAKRSLVRKFIEPLISLMIRRADAYITYNSYSEKYLKEEYGISSSLMFRAQNALDTSRIEDRIPDATERIRSDCFAQSLEKKKVVLFIGALDKRKRVNNLIAATKEINDEYSIPCKCLIVGDGPDLGWIRRQCSAEELLNCEFLGRQIELAVFYIMLSDVVVLPGQGGLSINHAFACGKPFVATREAVCPNSDSVYDYIQDGQNGYVANIDDVGDLARKIVAVMGDEEMYSRLSEGAKATSREVSVERMVDGIQNAIEYVVQE